MNSAFIYKSPNLENLMMNCEKRLSCPFNDRHSISDIFVRYCIQKVTGYNLCDIKIQRSENGKPYISDFSKLHFNLSHSKDLMICVVSKKQVGVDVEFVKEYEISEKLVPFFSNLEWEYIQSSGNKSQAFYELWTLKESYLKYLGIGLTKGLKFFEIVFKNKNYSITETGKLVPIFLQSFEFDSLYRVSICSHFNKAAILNQVSEEDLKNVIIQCHV